MKHNGRRNRTPKKKRIKKISITGSFQIEINSSQHSIFIEDILSSWQYKPFISDQNPHVTSPRSSQNQETKEQEEQRKQLQSFGCNMYLLQSANQAGVKISAMQRQCNKKEIACNTKLQLREESNISSTIARRPICGMHQSHTCNIRVQQVKILILSGIWAHPRLLQPSLVPLPGNSSTANTNIPLINHASSKCLKKYES